MNKTILIIIGIVCALLTAVGIMQYTYHSAHKKIHICYDTEVEPIVITDQTPGWLKEFFDESNKPKEKNDETGVITSPLKCKISLSSYANNTSTLSRLPYFEFGLNNKGPEPIKISRNDFINVSFSITQLNGHDVSICSIKDKGDGSSLAPVYKLGESIELKPTEYCYCFQGYFLEKMVTDNGNPFIFPAPGNYRIQACFPWNGTVIKSNVETIEADDRSIECSIQSDKTTYDVWDRPIITVTLKNTGTKPVEMRRNIEADYTRIDGTDYFTEDGSFFNSPATHYAGQFKDKKYGVISPLPTPKTYFDMGRPITTDEPETIPPGQAITLTYTFCNKLVNGKPFLNLGQREISANYSHFVRVQSNKIAINVEAKPQDGPPIDIVDSEWGPEENGLRIGLTADKSSITYGEPITLSLRLINVSNSLKQFYPLSMSDNLSIVGQNGNSGKNIACCYQTMSTGPHIIKRGQQFTLDTEDITKYNYHICKPDKYTIQWQSGNRRSNKLEIEIKVGHPDAFAEIFCRLIHIMPERWGTYLVSGFGASYPEIDLIKEGLVIGDCYILLLFPQCGIAENVEVWHTKKQVDISRTANDKDKRPLIREFLGKDKWGYAYIEISPEAGEKWPTAKQDIIKALEIH